MLLHLLNFLLYMLLVVVLNIGHNHLFDLFFAIQNLHPHALSNGVPRAVAFTPVDEGSSFIEATVISSNHNSVGEAHHIFLFLIDFISYIDKTFGNENDFAYFFELFEKDGAFAFKARL